MRLLEIMKTSIPANHSKQLIMLKNMIDNNEQPEVADASAKAGSFALGDVEQIGYGKFHREPVGRGEYKVWFTYTGPNVIVVDGKLLKRGDSTEPTFVDYT